jgi:hypothetical protein
MMSEYYKHITRNGPAQERRTDGRTRIGRGATGVCARGTDGFETDVAGNANARQ